MQSAAGHATTLPPRAHVRLYLLDEPASLSAATAQQFISWLSDEERQRWQRLRHDGDRQEFLLARAMVRSLLGVMLQQPPDSLRFSSNRHGKPELQQPGLPPLRFNLSHTRGLLALAVTVVDDIGVDVESLARKVEALALAERFFAASETSMLRSVPAPQLHETFMRLWTLKEAWVKARGPGLQLGLDAFAIGFADDGRPRLEHGDDDGSWSFFSAVHRDVFRLALAVNVPAACCETIVIDADSLL